MDRTEYTPTKVSKVGITTQSYIATNREGGRFAGQMSIMRQYEALKLQARQLEIQNRQLASDIDKLRYQKNMNESKLLQKAALEEEAMTQFQKQKNYQIQMLKLKNDQDLNRLKRQYEIRIEDIQRQIKGRQLQNGQLNNNFSFLENRAHQLRSKLEQLESQLIKYRDSNSTLTEQVTREEFANKKLQMLAEELQRQKNQMETQIHILLDIQAEKSRTISNYEIQLQQSQHSIANQHQKLKMLTDNFASLEDHISVMKERLLNAQMRGEEVDSHLQNTELQITQRQQLFMQQKDREHRLRDEIEAHKQREHQRISQIQQLIADNERIYSDINAIRFKLYDVSIEQGINI